MAIELLQQRLGNENLLINEHMSKLLNLHKVTFCNVLSGLQTLDGRIQTNVRSLENHGVHIVSYGVMLKKVLLQNLPYELVLKFNQLTLNKRQHEDHEWDGLTMSQRYLTCWTLKYEAGR